MPRSKDELTCRLLASDENRHLNGPYIFRVACPCGHADDYECSQEDWANEKSPCTTDGRVKTMFLERCWGHGEEDSDDEDEA